jgi:hypothetical protein
VHKLPGGQLAKATRASGEVDLALQCRLIESDLALNAA